MEKERIKLETGFDQEVLDKIDNYVTFINTYHKLHHNEDWKEAAIENFIRGAVNRELEKVETYNPLMVTLDKKVKKGLLKNRLKEILKERNIKQLDLAEMTGIDRSNLSLIMNNRNQPSADYLLRIHAALNYYPLDQLFYREKKGR